jgi:hypothetical protein
VQGPDFWPTPSTYIHTTILKLLRQINYLKFSRAISRLNAEQKTRISEISAVSIIRVDVVNDYISLIFIADCLIDASSYGCTMQQEGGVKLCGHLNDSNLPQCCLTSCPCCQIFCFLFSMLFSVSSWNYRDCAGVP